MASSFFPASGCVYAPTGTGTGAYAVSGIKSQVPVLITGAALTDSDIITPKICLNGKRIIYVFGRDFGDVAVMGLALLGEGGSAAFANLRANVDSRRLSAGGSGATYLSTPLGGYRLFIVGFGLSAPDADYQIQPFVIHGKLA